MGVQNGREWSIKYSSVGELESWSATFLLQENFIHGVPFPGENHYAGEMFDLMRSDAVDHDHYFDREAYVRGFLESVPEVWQAVKANL